MAITVNQMDVAVVPSNQHHNVAGGDPNPAPGITTEEQIQVISAMAAVGEFCRQGHNAKMFWVPGSGTASTDELSLMCKQGRTWLRTQPGKSFALSYHSNAGHAITVPDDLWMYPLIKSGTDATWAVNIAEDAATRTGFRPRSATVRSITFMSTFSYLPSNRVLLMEVGEHQDAIGAKYLWTYSQYHGIMVARAFITAAGYKLVEDGPVPEGVKVPEGSRFDKYRPEEEPPDWIEVPPQWSRLLKVTAPYMRGEDVAAVQERLVKLGYGVGASGVDTIYGRDTEAAVKKFQVDHHIPDSGMVGSTTWERLFR